MALVDEILTDVTDEATVIGSVEQLLTNLNQQLATALANGDTAKLAQIRDAIDANKTRLAAAVSANTGAPA